MIPSARPLRSTLIAVTCAALLAATLATPAGAGFGAGDPESEQHFPSTSHLELSLVNRTYVPEADAWDIVIEGTLDSNAICLPAIFDCIVEPQVSPTGGSLTDTTCLSPQWNHLIFFFQHCIKQFPSAGHDQKFRFTYRTNPGVTSGTFTSTVRFGRGFLPFIFNPLAQASITVDLDVTLHVLKECPDTVSSGEAVECAITVTYPDDGGGGPPITDTTVTDVPPAEFGTNALVAGPSGATWNCVDVACTLAAGSLDPGDVQTFVYSAQVTPTPDGGDVVNTAVLTYDDGSPQETSHSDAITIIGDDDTDVTLTKDPDEAIVEPGQEASYTITVTNDGSPSGLPNDAVNVRLTDTPSPYLLGATLAHVSGVGAWTCAALECVTPTMPLGAAVFRVTGTVATDIPPDTPLVNQAAIRWDNDIFGPDFPVQVGAAIEINMPPPAAPPSLPRTGGDVVPLTLGAAMLVAFGALLARLARARRAA